MNDSSPVPQPYSRARIVRESGTRATISSATACARSTFVGSSSQVAARASKSVAVVALVISGLQVAREVGTNGCPGAR